MMPREEIEEIVNRETRAWDTQDVDLLLSAPRIASDGVLHRPFEHAIEMGLI
jgi:hypothetical protein